MTLVGPARRELRRSMAAFAVIAASLVTIDARADDNAAAAQALFEEARSLMAKGDYAAACSKFEGSRSLDPAPGTEYNLAVCYEKSGRTASAWATYLNVAASYKATNRPEWEMRARERASALESKLSRLTIVAAPDSRGVVRIARDGTPLIASALGVAIPVDPGPHVVTASADDRGEWSARIDLAPGEKKMVEIPRTWAARDAHAARPHASAAPSPPPHAESSEQSSNEGSASPQKTVGLVVGGVGIVAIGVGTVTGLFAIDENSTSKKDCPNDGICRSPSALDANEAAGKWATASTISFVAGGVLLAAGAVLYFTAPKSSKRASAPLSLGAGARAVSVAW